MADMALSQSKATGIQDPARELDQTLLSFYAPAVIVVTRQFRVVERRGNLEPFGLPARVTKVPSGPLGDAIRRAVDASAECECPCSEVLSAIAAIHVVPLPSLKRRLFAVILQAPDQNGEDRVRQLEVQLAAARDYLAASLDDYESTTEELHSAHEELQSANEELQQLNEELREANDNLARLNGALEGRSRDLQRVNSELVNVLNNVGIAMVMLGSDLRIRRFNPQAERFFNLQDSDIGKPVREIHPSISLPHLEEACLDVLDSFTPRSRQVQDAQGRNFSLFFRPYRTAENRVEGVILALLEGSSVRVPPVASGD